MPFDQAVLNAGNAVFTAAASGNLRRAVVINPLVNGVTGEQSAGTRALAVRLEELRGSATRNSTSSRSTQGPSPPRRW
jgi:hypothetical protein